MTVPTRGRQHREKLTASNPTLIVNLNWEADTVIVINPNALRVNFRIGSPAFPDSSADADLIAPEKAITAYPVTSGTFGFRYDVRGGALPTEPVIIILTRDRPPPVFGFIQPATITVSGSISIPGGVTTNAGSVTTTQAGSTTTTGAGSQTTLPSGTAVTNQPGGPVTNTPTVTTGAGSQTTLPSGTAVTNQPGGPVTNTPTVTTGAGSQTTLPAGTAVTNQPGGPVTNNPGVTTLSGSVGTPNQSFSNASFVTGPYALTFGGAPLVIGPFSDLDCGGYQFTFTALAGNDMRLEWYWYQVPGGLTQIIRYIRIPVNAKTVVITIPATQNGSYFQLVNDEGGIASGWVFGKKVYTLINDLSVQTYQDNPVDVLQFNSVSVAGNVRGVQLFNTVSGVNYKFIQGFQFAASKVDAIAFIADLILYVGTAAAPVYPIGSYKMGPEFLVAGQYSYVINVPYSVPGSGNVGGFQLDINNCYLWLNSNVAGIDVKGSIFLRRRY